MGMHENIEHDKFPKQGDFLGKKCRVLFRFGSNNEPVLKGEIVRDDIESPFIIIIKLENGKYVTSGECQYSPE